MTTTMPLRNTVETVSTARQFLNHHISHMLIRDSIFGTMIDNLGEFTEFYKNALQLYSIEYQ